MKQASEQDSDIKSKMPFNFVRHVFSINVKMQKKKKKS